MRIEKAANRPSIKCKLQEKMLKRKNSMIFLKQLKQVNGCIDMSWS